MNETENEINSKKSEPESGPEPETGSPTTRPCATIVSDGTETETGTAAGPDPATSNLHTSIPHTLSLLFPEGSVVELRALGDGGVKSGYFTDFAALADRARVLDAFTDVTGVYVTLNAVDPALLSRRANRVKHRLSRSDATTADADICRRRWLPVDLDPVRPSGVSATDAEHAAALRRAEEIAAWLTKHGFPDPVRADSGNGAHLLYAIDLPNDDDATRLVKGCLGVLDGFFSDDAVRCDTANFNAGRIWKLYGTTACKGDSTPERPHRQARILSVPKHLEVVPEGDLRRLAGLLPTAPPAEDRGRRRGSFDLRWWLEYHGIPVAAEKPWHGGTLFSLAQCPFSSAHTDGAFAIQFPNGAVFAGCHHDFCGGGTQRWPELRAMYEGERETERAGGKQTTGRPQAKTEVAAGEGGMPAGPSPALPGATPPVSTLAETPEEGQAHRKRALEILTTGDPLAFLLDVFHREHVGDRTVAECLIMSVASQSVENTSGLHVAISGNSGKGKTHACNTMVRLLPEEYRLTGTVSDKALFYYDDLRAGTVLLFDDVTLSDDMQELLKSATANFRQPIVHRTLSRERSLKVCTIPERCVWWLAKVEAIGDDQVMNRMLTVWIDDSATQDLAVLEHLKESETGVSPSFDDDRDIPVCRAIWEVLKGAVRRVKIPYAKRICFSATHNRRNPAMLFDLIKCHTLMHFLQRETDGDGTLIATEEDFRYAEQLYGLINGSVGGQETKLTKNEAAALSSIAAMDLEVFTIRTLQDALGFSYKQAYRLLHGYTNTKATYAGILDKCPAISLISASVAEDLYGIDIRRHKHFFSFDPVMYQTWAARSDVWLKPDDGDDSADDNRHTGGGSDPKSSTLPPVFHPNPPKSGTLNNAHIDNCFDKEEMNRDICTDSTGVFHSFPVSFDSPVCRMEGDGGISDPGECGTQTVSTPVRPRNSGSSQDTSQNEWKTKWNTGETCGRQGPKTVGSTLPLPGILDYRDFRRSSVSLGRCTICGEGPAVYQSKAQRASICETCYARVVREWNRGEGVQ
ncbi:hypothetical protein L1S32_08425 [Methanogenium sp. S4BF]|uniref:hypothetical protein n=1 Tax=Methanogenium sp. S4BF TaxID=1789226 RepID=UPI002417719E|nr:hypothetical protein [Methanogenium sp. S4BF]WFN33867.1 hypothetical protein L1S32_08425 [Methanogenium sp. S4BF]